jgi:pimeloyl-ACP methyl ester carboxylesterase
VDFTALERIARAAGGGLLAAIVMAAPHLAAQTIQTFRSAVDDSDQPYALFVPKSVQADRKYPLVISLHAEQSNHRTNLRQVFGLPVRATESDRFPPNADAGYFVACPLARGTMGYQGVAETDVYDVLADVERRYPVDPDRVYLTGISMGGAGVLRLALTRPDVWAAVAAVAPAALNGIDDLVANALHLPIRLFHGELGLIAKPDISRTWHRKLLEAGVPVEYIEYPGIGQNAWETAYRNGAIFEWFGRQRRNPYPDQVRILTKSYRYARAYWITIDGLTPGVAATIDARRTSPQEIQVSTSGVDGFTLSLDRPATLVRIDGAAIRAKSATSLSFEKTAGRWRAGRYQPGGKRPGAEGPISEALAGRQIYVYGTLGASREEELAARRRVAAAAAAWSSNQARLGLTFAVKADSAVTAADLDAADVILFGSPETNSLIARFASKLPLQLNAGAADYGLLFIASIGKRYALVSSGLPWLSGTSGAGEWEPAGDGGDPFAPATYRILSGFGDYVLFKGSTANVVAGGRFTSDWKVPAADASRLLATGTVTIH